MITAGVCGSAELLQLQAALQAAFPLCTDLSDDPARGITAFRPHLSLGQWRSAGDVKAAQQARRVRNCIPRRAVHHVIASASMQLVFCFAQHVQLIERHRLIASMEDCSAALGNVGMRLFYAGDHRCVGLQELEAAWRPVTFTVDSVALISRSSFHDPFRIRWQVGLGSGNGGSSGSEAQDNQRVVSIPREVNVPYVATCGGRAPSSDDGDLVSFTTVSVKSSHMGKPQKGRRAGSQELLSTLGLSESNVRAL